MTDPNEQDAPPPDDAEQPPPAVEDQQDSGEATSEEKRKPSQRPSNRTLRKNSPLDEEEDENLPPRSNLRYGFQIFRAAIIFIVGCSISCEMTGIVLWHCFEKRG